MFKKILLIVLGLIVIVGGLALIFRGKTQSLLQSVSGKNHLGQVKTSGNPSKDYQMSIVYTKNPASQIQDLNAHWARLQVRWDQLEPKQGEYKWEELDNYVKEASKAKIGLSLIIYTGQGKWSTICDPKIAPLNKKTHCPPSDLSSTWNDQYGYSQSYYTFINDLAKRYKGKIDEYIIHNEVNTLRFWHGTPEQYLELRKTGYKAIHDADSKAIVIDNSLASPVWGAAITKELLDEGKDQEAVDFYNRYFYRAQGFTKVSSRQDIMNAAAKNDEWTRAIDFANKVFTEPTFDWAGFHFYDPQPCFLEVVSFIKEQMQKNGYEKPIAMTEGGFSDNTTTFDDPAAEQKVAEDLVKMQVSGFANGLTMFAWLPVQEGMLNEDNSQKLKGLFSKEGQINPAGTVWAYLNNLIVKDVSIKDQSKGGINIYAITNHQENTYVVWSDSLKKISASTIGKNTFDVVDIFGKTLKEGVSSYDVSGEPVYLK